ncbi:MAG: hypothetical protein V4663_10455 [Bacteroidota bacterium]
MKILKISILFIITTLSLFSCKKLEETRFVYDGPAQIEFDASALNAITSPRTYPILTRVPGYGRGIITTSVPATGVVADPLLTRTSGSVKFRVNLITAQQSTAQTINYRVVNTEKDAAGVDVVVTTAIAGTHYNTTGSFIIPANSSFGEITIDILNPGATTGTKDLVIEIVGNSAIKPSVNYSKLGLRIAQN